jgi:SPP1 family predicted phage head-tail adaptor
MRWSDIIKLVDVSYSENSLGDITETKTERQVYANKSSVKRSEFYQAAATGLKPETVFEIRLIDYEGETKLTYEGDEYNVIRTYSKDGEIIELICNRLINDVAVNLTGLIVTTATLSPIFSGTTYSYTSNVANGVTSVTVTPTCANATEIRINDVIVESGSASGAISLAVGTNTITVILRKTATPTKTYTITITRAAA